MKHIPQIILIGIVGVFMCSEATAGTRKKWKVGVQAYSYRKFSFFETVDKLTELGIKYVEIYPGQKIGGGVEGKTHHNMSEESREAMLMKAKAGGVKIVSYGVVKEGNEAGWRKVFEFAKDLKLLVVTENPGDKAEMIDKLANEYKTKVALHNHTSPSPDAVARTLEGRSRMFGGSPDNGHWTRAKHDNIKSMKKYEGRIFSMHLKDVDKREDSAKCVPFGQGIVPLQEIFEELERQEFKGALILEYESESNNPCPAVKQCLEVINRYIKTGNVSSDEFASLDDLNDVFENVDLKEKSGWADFKIDPKPDNPTKVSLDGNKGIITVSNPGANAQEGPEKAFQERGKYCTRHKTMWLQYQYPDGKKPLIKAYTIKSANDAQGRDPKDWKLLGSNDGKKYDVLDERSNEKFDDRHTERSFKVKNPGSYNIYKLDVTKNGGEAITQLAQIKLLETEEAKSSQSTGIKGKTGDLFKKDLSNAVFQDGGWAFENGVLTAKGKGDIWTKERYDNFVLELDFKCERDTNSGVFIRCRKISDWLHGSIEVQILQPDHDNKKWTCGAIFDVLAPKERAIKEPGEWNHYKITAKNNKIEVVLNGKQVIDMDLNQWTEAHKNPDGSKNKFNTAYKDMAREGLIGFQYHGHHVEFRNLKIKTL